MSSRIVVHRREAEEIKRIGGWILLFGRRKVGKTYLIRNFLDYDHYFYVRVDGAISSEDGDYIYNDLEKFAKDVKKLLKGEERVVIDEFQRLPEWVIEEISRVHPHGKLILSGSSMRIVSRVISRKSPLLGILYPYRLGLINPLDILNTLKEYVSMMDAVELAPYLRDPWTIPLFTDKDGYFRNLFSIIQYAVPGLIGEIFTAEEREMTKTYESLLALLGEGISDYREIARILFARNIIKKPESSMVLPYIKNLEGMGLVEKIKIYGKKRYLYRLISEEMNMYYYLDSKYDFSRNPSYEEVMPTIEKLKTFAVENFIGDLFAEILRGKKEVLKTAEREIDFIITVRNKPIIVGEVKWGKLTKKDVEKFLSKSEDFYCRKIIFTKKKRNFDGVEILEADDLDKFF